LLLGVSVHRGGALNLKHVHTLFFIGFLVWTIFIIIYIPYGSYIYWEGSILVDSQEWRIVSTLGSVRLFGAILLLAAIAIALLSGIDMPKGRWKRLGFAMLNAGLVLFLVSYITGPYSGQFYFLHNQLANMTFVIVGVLWFYLVSVGIGIMVFGGVLPREHERIEPRHISFAG